MEKQVNEFDKKFQKANGKKQMTEINGKCMPKFSWTATAAYSVYYTRKEFKRKF